MNISLQKKKELRHTKSIDDNYDIVCVEKSSTQVSLVSLERDMVVLRYFEVPFLLELLITTIEKLNFVTCLGTGHLAAILDFKMVAILKSNMVVS